MLGEQSLKKRWHEASERSGRSAELHSAVSPSCTRQAVRHFGEFQGLRPRRMKFCGTAE